MLASQIAVEFTIALAWSAMANNIRSALDSLAHAFASAVLAAIRGASIEDLLTESGGPLRPGPGRRHQRGSGAGNPAKARKTRSGRLARRSAEEIANALDQVVALVNQSKTWLRSEEIRKTLNLDVREMPRILKTGIQSKKLKAKGQKRATTYSAGTKATATKSTPTLTKKPTTKTSSAAPRKKGKSGSAKKRAANQPSSQPTGPAGPAGSTKK
jgi:hypothetical protein